MDLAYGVFLTVIDVVIQVSLFKHNQCMLFNIAK